MGQPLLNSNDPLADLMRHAVEVFGSSDAASAWLETPLWELDNLSPAETASRCGAAGFDRARDVLLRIEYGVFS